MVRMGAALARARNVACAYSCVGEVECTVVKGGCMTIINDSGKLHILPLPDRLVLHHTVPLHNLDKGAWINTVVDTVVVFIW